MLSLGVNYPFFSLVQKINGNQGGVPDEAPQVEKAKLKLIVNAGIHFCVFKLKRTVIWLTHAKIEKNGNEKLIP
jgi:hypothetical protein